MMAGVIHDDHFATHAMDALDAVWMSGDVPAILDVNGARILVTLGEHDDPWNRVD